MSASSHVRRQARKLLDDGRPAEAARLLVEILRDHPEDTRARDYLAAAYYDMGAYEDCLDELRRVVHEWPQKARCWRNYAMLLRKLGRLDEAEEAIEEALHRDPEYKRALVERRKIRRALFLPICRSCGLPIEREDEVACQGCGWQYHRQCWGEEGGCINPQCKAGELTIETPARVGQPPVPRVSEKRGCLPTASLLLFCFVAAGFALAWR